MFVNTQRSANDGSSIVSDRRQVIMVASLVGCKTPDIGQMSDTRYRSDVRHQISVKYIRHQISDIHQISVRYQTTDIGQMQHSRYWSDVRY